MTFWWRDDDAAADDPRLERLLAIAEAHAVPIALAVVPERLEAAAVRRILACPWAQVLQHGLAHQDHRSLDGRKCELVDRLDLDGRLVAARVMLAERFGERFVPVLVPPWNRIEPGLRARLPELGFTGLSTFAGRRSPPPVPGLCQRDTHVDVIRWREDRRHLDAVEIVAALDAAVARHAGPLGLLSHHLVTDASGFVALDRAIGLLQDRPDATFRASDTLFRGPAAA
ncbi:polysaccharide deacetylase family protein [Geminicoccus flavidas]|uniref:glycosyl transferase family 28 n=1 Tax=Geminicoccus flavidas TaxID=2506407 RepID=UPI001356BD5B|nr:glycosyl transferase family 28 [Geminicoccus flavidas]